MPEAIDDAAVLLRRRAGLSDMAASRSRLQRLLEQGAAEAGVAIGSYVGMVDTDPEKFRELLDRATIQHSDFFRDPAQLVALAKLLVLDDRPGTIWSAGCGNGQEPYTLAMVLDEVGRHDWHIVATDISRSAINRTRLATYSDVDVRGLSPERRKRYLHPIAGGFEVEPSIRRRVQVAGHNLSLTERPPVSSCRVIFCRNVLMYFGREESEACIERFAEILPPGGSLFLGRSDSPGRLSKWFTTVRMGDALFYERLRPPHVPAAAVGRRATDTQPFPKSSVFITQGQSAAARGNLSEAVRLFRQATYLDPNLSIAYFLLGTALEMAGDHREARRAFAAAGLALMRAEADADLSALEGYTGRDLARAIAHRLTAPHRIADA